MRGLETFSRDDGQAAGCRSQELMSPKELNLLCGISSSSSESCERSSLSQRGRFPGPHETILLAHMVSIISPRPCVAHSWMVGVSVGVDTSTADKATGVGSPQVPIHVVENDRSGCIGSGFSEALVTISLASIKGGSCVEVTSTFGAPNVMGVPPSPSENTVGSFLTAAHNAPGVF